MHQFALEQTNDYLRQQNNALSAKMKINQKKNAALRVENKDLLRSNKDCLQRFLSNVQRRNVDLRDTDFKNAIDMQTFARHMMLPNSMPVATLEKGTAGTLDSKSQVATSEPSQIPKDLPAVLPTSDPGGLFTRSMKVPTVPNAEGSKLLFRQSIAGFFQQSLGVLAAVASAAKGKKGGANGQIEGEKTGEAPSPLAADNVATQVVVPQVGRVDGTPKEGGGDREAAGGKADPWQEWLNSMWQLQSHAQPRRVPPPNWAVPAS